MWGILLKMLEGEMKGKTFVLGVMLLMFMAFFGCSTNTRECVLQNMSETTKDFYFGENTKFYATLAYFYYVPRGT